MGDNDDVNGHDYGDDVDDVCVCVVHNEEHQRNYIRDGSWKRRNCVKRPYQEAKMFDYGRV